MKKLIITAVFACITAVSAAQAQQATGGIANNKKQAIESLNAIRFDKMSSALRENIDAMGKIDVANDNKIKALKVQQDADLQDLTTKLTKLEALVYRLASCKPTTISGCQLPQINLGETGNGTCGSGTVFNRPVPVGQFYFGAQCSYKCGEEGQTKVVNHCGIPKNCAATKNKSFSLGNFFMTSGSLTFASLPAAKHGETVTAGCSSRTNCSYAWTNPVACSNCKATCSNGTWVTPVKGSCVAGGTCYSPGTPIF